jgi:hypothetical protein
MQTTGACQVGTDSPGSQRCLRPCMRVVVHPRCCTSCCTELIRKLSTVFTSGASNHEHSFLRRAHGARANADSQTVSSMNIRRDGQRAWSSPLDDAMHELDSKERAAAEWTRTQETERDRTRAAYRELTCDFLARMNAAGNPGTETISYTLRRFKTIRSQGWRLQYDRGSEVRRAIFLTTDGRIDSFNGQPPTSASEFDFAMWGDGSFKDLSLSMAELLRRYVSDS